MASVSSSCPHCGSIQIDINQAQGDSYCTSCGIVLEENTIVSEVTFQELSTGATALQGQFVSAEHGLKTMGGAGGSRSARYMTPTESRQITLNQARYRLQRVAAMVHLSEHHVDMAHRWFTLALSHQFTKGRKSLVVAVACLYIVCRQEKTSHMLIDFSECLRMNVYELGNTFLKLIRLLNLDIPLVDPSLYIGRFAAKLGFQSKTSEIANLSLRLVSRMKRDWINTGRRPGGICGACLLIAAKMMGYDRTREEIIRVVKVCDATLMKRLQEFSETPSGQLTVEEFQSVWLDQEADPPAFKTAQSKEMKILNEETLNEDVQTATFSGSKYLDEDMEESLAKVLQPFEDEEIEKQIDEALEMAELIETKPLAEEELLCSDLDDEEVEACILDKDEIEAKTSVWESLNADYIKKMEERKNKEPEEKVKKTRKKRKTADPKEPAESAIEATKQILQTKKYSKRINYSALDQLFKNNNEEEKLNVEPTEELPIEPQETVTARSLLGYNEEDETLEHYESEY